MGLSTSLGRLHPACAAFRAGMARPSAASGFTLSLVEERDDAAPEATVHAARGVTEGFSGVGRLVALLTDALEDLGTREDLAASLPHVALYLALPDPAERGFGLPDAPGRQAPPEPAARLTLLGERVAHGAFGVLGLTPPALRVFGGGETAFAQALQAAQADVLARRVAGALVCAADSLCAEHALELLAERHALKTPEEPVGLMPGEAGVALLLVPAPRSAVAAPALLLAGVQLGRDRPHAPGEPPSHGRVLAEAALTVLQGAPRPVVLTDHTGQPHRAHEWGMLQVQWAQRLLPCDAWLPALGFGHTGAAVGGVQVALALRALERGYAPAPSFLALMSADAGERAAVNLVAHVPRQS